MKLARNMCLPGCIKLLITTNVINNRQSISGKNELVRYVKLLTAMMYKK